MNQSINTAAGDSRTLAASLVPLVVDACQGRLGQITWFKADWQRGGAATARATFQNDEIADVAVVLKLPVVQRELLWMQRLNNAKAGAPGEMPVPQLFAGDETLGGYDLAWMVIERLPHGPLGLHWHDDHIPRVVDAAACFHAIAREYAIDQVPTSEPWEQMIDEAATSLRVNNIAHQQRWLTAMKSLRHRLQQLVREWNNRSEDQWLHGDLHLANAMSRVSAESGPVCLIDLAEVHAGHWVEDAIYLERQFWARPERTKAHKPVRALAVARKKLGLPVESDYPRLAMIRRALLASTAPKFIKSEGHPAYLEACLGWLETSLNDLK
ncbi:MAG: aminoglycoside phosphotransferase family protein [Phycisphaerales bacterium]|nr:aminoglycoside phosphotransferase family protein [Phycisphaerales bacterium]MCI0629191.1 aminoglycoside phosphotransferase family protein [Phycisphaerales bacterium]MCI0677266.1 aminoglycoside phosphotransferase family protein [Phycisphaerales bacterium]